MLEDVLYSPRKHLALRFAQRELRAVSSTTVIIWYLAPTLPDCGRLHARSACCSAQGLALAPLLILSGASIAFPRHDTFELLMSALELTAQQRALFLGLVRPEMTATTAQTFSPSRFPLPPTPLIGREQELTHALTLLSSDRSTFTHDSPDQRVLARPGWRFKSRKTWTSISPMELCLFRLHRFIMQRSCQEK